MHRDIVCETDYSPLSNAELARQIEWHASAMGGASAYDLERVTGPARALLARAEAAEADRDDAVAVELSDVLILLGLDPNDFELDQMRGVTHGVIDAMRQRNDALAARVAELEAQLAAQQWRPVTNEWPPQEESTPVRMRNGVIRWGYRHGDRWHLTGGQYSRESVTHAYALPPAPDAAEATE